MYALTLGGLFAFAGLALARVRRFALCRKKVAYCVPCLAAAVAAAPKFPGKDCGAVIQ